MIVVEFSLSQKAFHVQTMNEMIVNNLMNALQRKQTDYLPIAYFNTRGEADIFVEENYEQLKDYSMYKKL